MARFIFKLQPVLRQREIVEQQKQRELAGKQQVYADLESRLKAMQSQVEATLADLRSNHLVGKLDLHFLASHRRFINAMQREAVGLAQQMGPAKLAVDAARARLAEASKQKKVVEKLREHQHASWQAAEAKSENALLDEVGMQLAYENFRNEAEPSE